MRREIKLIEKGDVNKLAKAFNVTSRTVYSALKGTTSNDLANKIRNVAVKTSGGYYLKDMPVDGVVTIHEGRIITHYFYGRNKYGERVLEHSLWIDTEAGDVKHYIDGKVKETYKNISIDRVDLLILDVCKSVGLDYGKYF